MLRETVKESASKGYHQPASSDKMKGLWRRRDQNVINTRSG
jgi:hypothetical protein